MTLNSFKDVQKLLTDFVKSQGIRISKAPHGDFWSKATYAQFTAGNVPGVKDPNDPTKGMPILTIGDSKNSNIILALSGIGPIFGPPGPPTNIGPMPPFPPPAMPADQIKALAAWIDAKCPE